MLHHVLWIAIVLALPGPGAAQLVHVGLDSANHTSRCVASDRHRAASPSSEVDDDGTDASADAAVIGTGAHPACVVGRPLRSVARSSTLRATRVVRPRVPRGPPSRLTQA